MDVRSVIHQPVHPGLLKADVADAEVCFAVSQGYQLLRNRVVCLRTGTFRDHAHYRKLVTGNRFREVALRFNGDGNDRFCFFVALDVRPVQAANRRQEPRRRSVFRSFSCCFMTIVLISGVATFSLYLCISIFQLLAFLSASGHVVFPAFLPEDREGALR